MRAKKATNGCQPTWADLPAISAILKGPPSCFRVVLPVNKPSISRKETLVIRETRWYAKPKASIGPNLSSIHSEGGVTWGNKPRAWNGSESGAIGGKSPCLKDLTWRAPAASWISRAKPCSPVSAFKRSQRNVFQLGTGSNSSRIGAPL